MAFVTFIIISNKCLTTNTIMRQRYYLCNCKNYFHFKEDVKRPQIPSIASANQDDKELDDAKEELTNVEPENRRKGKDVLLSTNCTTKYLQHEDFAPLLEVCNSVNQISVPEGEGEFFSLLSHLRSLNIYSDRDGFLRVCDIVPFQKSYMGHDSIWCVMNHFLPSCFKKVMGHSLH